MQAYIIYRHVTIVYIVPLRNRKFVPNYINNSHVVYIPWIVVIGEGNVGDELSAIGCSIISSSSNCISESRQVYCWEDWLVDLLLQTCSSQMVGGHRLSRSKWMIGHWQGKRAWVLQSMRTESESCFGGYCTVLHGPWSFLLTPWGITLDCTQKRSSWAYTVSMCFLFVESVLEVGLWFSFCM